MGNKAKVSLKFLLPTFLLAQVFSGFAVAKDENSKLIPDTDIEIGKRIYREGILSSGEPMSGFVQGDIPIKGTHLACGSCHRRSGLGGVEGNITTPQITGDILYAPVTSRASKIFKLRKPDEKTRPAYTDDLLAIAIREGRNPTGRKLNKLMPHYILSPVDMAYLT
ncbi:MAG: hypothetical protein KAU29_03635, partial [Gammaproteobacteria bacterium]|nr:hypothetical protein [Gammaproteobacteria bacterium]